MPRAAKDLCVTPEQMIQKLQGIRNILSILIAGLGRRWWGGRSLLAALALACQMLRWDPTMAALLQRSSSRRWEHRWKL